jgi:hypothetical protein
MAAVLRDDPRPVYVTGEQAALSLPGEAGAVAGGAVHIRHGGLAHAAPDTLGQTVHAVHEAELRKAATDVAREPAPARGRHRGRPAVPNGQPAVPVPAARITAGGRERGRAP